LRLSIIIPALNEALVIEKCLQSIFSQGVECQVIVVDGGSRDGTPDLVPPPAKLISAPKGRARQMNAGAAVAAGEVLLFLHADTVLPPGGLESLLQALANSAAPGGAFRLDFDQSSPLLKFFAWCTRFRFRLLHYGDAGIFVRREVFQSLGGYADLAIMEDLDLWLKLRKEGRPLILPLALTTSARRFVERGVIRQQSLNVSLVVLWLLGVNHRKLADWYYGQDGG
jgi:rSAM/selenodomain-associated transferase 2